MTDKNLKDLLSEADQQPGEDVKQRHLAAAMDAYERSYHATNGQDSTQGNAEGDRQTSHIHTMSRRQPMLALSQRTFWSGLSSAAVLVLAVALLFNVNEPADSVITDIDALIEPGMPAENEADARTSADANSSKNYSGNSQSQEVASPEMRSAKIEEVIVTAAKTRVTGTLAAQRQQVSERFAEIANVAEMSRSPMAPPGMMPEPFPGTDNRDGRDQFEKIESNTVMRVTDSPVSTFSIDVDTASYSFVRSQLNQGRLPVKDAVRLEEMVNYFDYAYPGPEDSSQPFNISLNVIDSPWHQTNKLLHVGIKGYEVVNPQVRSNLVFLLDVSGSMGQPNKLPLVKQSMALLVDQLQPEDTVAIVVYAGAAGTVLEPTPVSEKGKILAALGRLNAGGTTAGAAGIRLAYQLAQQNFVESGVNRVFVATDGDFNVGITSPDELEGFVERKRDAGIYLSVLGFGEGNYNDRLMQRLAQNGNGIAAYIDTLGEAQKVLVDEATSTLFPIANDVKIQVEFNPATVSEYRLLGYETRKLNREDFDNDAVDAGEIGAGHAVTALYEITPVGEEGRISNSRYEQAASVAGVDGSDGSDGRKDELGYVNVRYKLPGEAQSSLVSAPIPVKQSSSELDEETRFAAAVAGFAQLLRDARYTGDWDYEDALALARANKGADTYGYRAEFTQLIRKATIASEM